ncbi:glycoside hydrolase family 2, partial [bacterium]|nr:glycoside hydrolase family 2 [bacterium]
QETFPGHRGLAWYWRDFEAPVNPHDQGRYLLRFWTVSYKADVWVNGIHVGGHEGGEDAFVFDVTDAIKSNTCNRIAVRVLNPTDEPIDGIIRSEVPQMGYEGGILDSVELLVVPAVQVEDLFVIPDSKMGDISIQANVRNTLKEPAKVNIVLTVAPAMSGETLDVTSVEEELKPGDTLINTKLKVKSPKLWDLNAPTLYRVTARAYIAGLNSFDEQSTRCGYRDFRFENGYFRLNGRRILLKGALHMPVSPISGRVPYDPDFPRRDLLQLKVMGFNMVRFIAGIPRRCQLDLADEIGLMVYEESFASWLWEDSPKMPARFNNSTVGMIKRDRNHPSIVMWGLLNENFNGELLRHAVKSLPLVRSLDETRVVILNSGRHDHQLEIGSISNPGSMVWEDILDEGHPYRGVPHSAEVISFLRTVGDRAYFISEYGNGTAQNLVRLTRQYEQHNAEHASQGYQHQLEAFMRDWDRWKMADTFANPEDYFRLSLSKLAGQRLNGFNAIRANPNVVGYLLTGTNDHGRGAGLNTMFRELKPGTVDALFDINAPLRWCLFVEPVNVYRNTSVRLEAVLANEDSLQPGEYPVRLQVVGPNCTRIFERTITVTIPELNSQPKPPFAMQVFSEDVVIDGPSGKYRFLAVFERGGAATGGDVEFYVADAAEMPTVEAEVVLWGKDVELEKWLKEKGIRTRAFNSDVEVGRELILVSHKPAEPDGREAFKDLVRRIGRGSTVVFLSPEVFNKSADWYQHPDQPLGWLPLANKGTLANLGHAVYPKDDWAKNLYSF